MKITAIILFTCIYTLFATEANSQNAKVSIHANNFPVREVIHEIEKQTDYLFVYDKGEVNVNRVVTLNADNAPVTDVLNKVFEGTEVEYRLVGKNITLTRREGFPETNSINQQSSKKITGTIFDGLGEPVIGANVVEKGTMNGIITDIDGKFTISVSENAVLQISYIGYIHQEIPIRNQTSLSIILQEDTKALDEVIVIGYGTTTKKEFTGSVTSFKLEDSPISLSSNINALETLKGNVAGLDIGATNTAGGQPSMLVRGQRSLDGSSDPLIVVDGVIFMGNISDINPNDIATFDILKDATSAAAYGSRSANGVIVISTKRGKIGKPVINMNVTGSMQNWHRRPDLMQGEQWLNMVRDKNRYNDYSFLTRQQEVNYKAGKEENWLDATSRMGWIQDYQVSVSGAGEKMNYYLSTSFTDNQGIVVGDDFSRMTVMGKIDTNITDWLKIGVDAAYTHADYSGVGANLYSAILLTPYDMMYRDKERTLLEKYPNGQNDFVNALWGVDSDNRDNTDIRNTFRINTFMVVKLPWIEGLSYRLNYSGNLNYRRTGDFYHESYYAPLGSYDDESRYSIATQQNYLASANGKVSNEKTDSWVIDNILNYKNQFGRHNIDLTLVTTRDSKTYKYEEMTGSNFASNGNTSLGISGLHYATVQKFSFNNIKTRNAGYFGRASYSFNDRYYLTASYRRDGSSVFGADNKWGNFWAIGSAWRISSESFMQSFDFLTDLKLKLSWGKNGNQTLGSYGTLSTVSAGSSGGVVYPFNNDETPSYGIKQKALGNSHLGWEETNAWNTGFESSWLNNRLFIDLDIYFSTTSNQIFDRTIPAMTGFNTMKSTMGEVTNKGVEMTIRSVNIQNKDLTWDTGLTFWLNRNKLKHLYGEDLDGDGKEDDDIGNMLFIGHSINSIYGYKQNGIVQTSDTEYMNANGVPAGTPKYVDMDGDKTITIADRSIVGNKDPRFKLSLSNTLTWKSWSLYVMMTGTFGGKGYYQASNKPAYIAAGETGSFFSNNLYVPYWTESNPSNKYPAAWYLGDDYFMGLQSRAFVRLQDVTLSYTFNQPGIKNLGINNLKVFFTGRNLATITGWQGGDPEMGNTILSGTWPVSTTLSLGANISF